MLAKKKEKDVIDRMLDQIDFHGMTAEELAGENGLLKQLTSRFYSRALDAEMDEHLGYKKNDNAGDNSTVPLIRLSFPNMKNGLRFSTTRLFRCTHSE